MSFVSPNLSWLPHSPSDALRAKIPLNTATRSRKVWPRKDRRLLYFSQRQFLKRVQSLETWDLGSGQNRTIKQKQTQNLSKNMYLHAQDRSIWMCPIFKTVLRVLLDEEFSKLLMEFWMLA